jgi:hypothetical protein
MTEDFGTPLIDAVLFMRSVLYIPLGRRVKRDVSIPVNLPYIQYNIYLHHRTLLSRPSTHSFLIVHDQMLFYVNSYDNNIIFSVVRLD